MSETTPTITGDAVLIAAIKKALTDSSPDRAKLLAATSHEITDVFTLALDLLKKSIPFVPGDGSANEKLFKAYRSQILNAGNEAIRRTEVNMNCCIIQQVVERVEVQRLKSTTHGPWALPLGVRMRGE